MNSNYEKAKTGLMAAVPLRILEMKKLSWSELQPIIARAAADLHRCAEAMVAGGGKPGQAAAGFNAVADAIAALSFVPGGIKLFGLHYESKFGEDAVETK